MDRVCAVAPDAEQTNRPNRIGPGLHRQALVGSDYRRGIRLGYQVSHSSASSDFRRGTGPRALWTLLFCGDRDAWDCGIQNRHWQGVEDLERTVLKKMLRT